MVFTFKVVQLQPHLLPRAHNWQISDRANEQPASALLPVLLASACALDPNSDP